MIKGRDAMNIFTSANNPNYRTLSHWIALDRSISTTDTFKITLFPGTENAVEISGDDISDTLDHDLGNYTVIKCENHTDFIFEWTRFVRIHQHDFERIYTALYAEYNPIENYNKNSTITDDGETGAPSNSPIISTIEQVADDTVSTETPYIPQNRTTSYGKTENNNTRTELTHGNIGVMTNQSMITDEITMRLHYNMVNIICRAYADLELI